MKVLLNSQQWPDIVYMRQVVAADKVEIEGFENYQKQSYRNRFRILSANGTLDLSVPVQHTGKKMLMRDVQISYNTRWQQQHWGAIMSAYGSAPYFLYFSEEIQSVYQRREKFLIDLNFSQLEVILRILRINKEVARSTEYVVEPQFTIDCRDISHPKRQTASGAETRPYRQTFSDKFGFVPDLSVLDMLFNTGLDTVQGLMY